MLIKKNLLFGLLGSYLLYELFLKSNDVDNNGNGNGNNFGTWDIIVSPMVLRNDSAGLGHYGASRGNKTHRGVDLICYKGQPVYAPFSGLITREFYAYSGDTKYKGIELSDQNGVKVKIMYVNPDQSKIGQQVYTGEIIATCQAISEKYNPNMLDHIHVEKWENGVNVDITNDLQNIA